MSRCPVPCILCDDRTCIQYKRHWTCGGHKLHIGDNIRDIYTLRTGFIYDLNQYASKRSVFVIWDITQGNNQGKLYWGDHACTELEKLNTRRPVNKGHFSGSVV